MARGKPVVLHARVGLMIALVAAAVALAVRPASAVDFYRWVDDRGGVHYSNAPSEVPPGKAATRISMKEGPISSGRAPSQVGTAADEETEEGLEAGADGQGRAPLVSGVGREKPGPETSARASLNRPGLRRELDAAAAEVAEIDQRLDTLAKLRTQWARRSNPSVGGLLAVGAADVRSREEEVLAERREGLTKRIEEIRVRLAASPVE